MASNDPESRQASQSPLANNTGTHQTATVLNRLIRLRSIVSDTVSRGHNTKGAVTQNDATAT